MFRRVRTAFLIVLALLVGGFGTLVVLAKVYDAEVKAKVVGALNQRLTAPVSVSDMELTLIDRFPSASIRLNDVLAREMRYDGIPPDTLLYAHQLHLELSLWDILRGRYIVERIHGDGVRFLPAMDSEGRENYRIWVADSAGTENSPLELQGLTFEHLSLRYRDARNGLELSTTSERIKLSGRFGDTVDRAKVEGDILLHHWIMRERELIADRDLVVRLAMTFGVDGSFHIEKGELNLGGVPLELAVDLVPEGPSRKLDLRAKGLGLDLGDVVKALPPDMIRTLSGYGMQGEVDLALRYTGSLEGQGPALSIGANVRKGRMKERRSEISFTDINGELAMEFTPEGVAKRIVVKDLSARSSTGSIRGDWESSGLKNATVKAHLRADQSLSELVRFAKLDTLEQAEGKLDLDIRVDGRVRDVADLKATDLRALKITGKASLLDTGLKLRGLRHRVSDLNATFTLNGIDATVTGATARIQDQPIALSGTVHDLMPYLLFEDHRLVISAQFAAERLDLGTLLQEEEGSAPKGDYELTLPALISVDLQAHVSTLVFEAFKAEDVRGTVRLNDRVLTLAPLSFRTASGTVVGDLRFDARGQGVERSHPLTIHATFQDIDVKQLFAEFQDFGQDFIGHRHLSGRTRAQVALEAPLSPALKLDLQRLVCVVDIAVENGSIKDHAPLLAIADHLRKNKLVAPFVNTDELRKRLGDVGFARMENQIEIKNGAVHVPAMEIKSSALDIGLSGTHWFDDRIDHHIHFRMSDLFRMGRSSSDEFGPIADDGTGMRLFLHMYGTASDPQFANDGAMAADKRRKQLEQEKSELKSILREELGLFRSGSTTASPTAPNTATAPVFQLEWDKADSVVAPVVTKPRKGLGRLLKEEKGKEEQERIRIEE